MAKLFGYNGAIVRFARTESEEISLGPTPEYDIELEFDADTNTEAVHGLDTDWNAHTLSGGVLRRDGKPVIINPPGEDYLGRRQNKSILELLKKYAGGLGGLSEIEFGYAMLGRLFAKANGEGDPTIFAIMDKDGAQGYITSLSQWGNSTGVMRQWMALELEVLAYFVMIFRAVLTNG